MHQFENTNSYLVEKSLDGLYFGEKEQISDTLSVIPLITNNPSEAELLTLSEAYRDRLVEIEETGKVNRVTIRNLSNKALLLTNGEILEGAKQNRTLNDSTLLPSNGQFDIDVSCVEQNRWSANYGEFTPSNDHHNFIAKGNKMNEVNRSKLETGTKHANQSNIWRDVQAKQEKLNVHSRTQSINDSYKSVHSELRDYSRKIRNVPNQVGLVFYIKNTCLGMETFANAKLWRTYSNKILKSIFIDAIEIERDAHRQMFQTVSTEREIYIKFYNFMKSLKERVIKGPYLGEEVVMNYPDLDFTASGIHWEGSMIHLNAFQKIT